MQKNWQGTFLAWELKSRSQLAKQHESSSGNNERLADLIRVKGDSMGPRIEDGDLILVDYSKEPRPGNVVVAIINGGAIVKKFLRQKGRIILRSTNPKYADIVISESDPFLIAGVVLRIVEDAL